MAQKINPISLRLEKTNRTIDSSWFNQCNYVNLLMKDLKIQWYINLILKKIKFCSARYSILHLPTKIKVNMFFYNGNKNKKYICKIFYLNYPKKTKTIQKKFFNQTHIKFSVKQKQVSNYLITSFNNEFSRDDFPVALQRKGPRGNQLMLQTSALESKHYKDYENNVLAGNRFCKNLKLKKTNENKKHVSFSQNALSIKNTTKNNATILFENYFKLLYFIKSYNQFYIRYFLVKYFSMKLAFNLNFKEKLQAVHEKKNLHSIKNVEKVFSSKYELNNRKTFYSYSSLEKSEFYKKMFFKHIFGFLFLQMNKNKIFLFLQYFQIKINNYKKLIPGGMKNHEFKQNFYNTNPNYIEKKYNPNYENVNKTPFVETSLRKKKVFSNQENRLLLFPFANISTELTYKPVKKATAFFIDKIQSGNKSKPTFKSSLQNLFETIYKQSQTISLKPLSFKYKKPKVFFSTNFLHLKLNILDFLKKNTLNYIDLKNEKSKFCFNADFKTKSNFNGLTKLTDISYKLQFSVKNMHEINSSTVLRLAGFSPILQESKNIGKPTFKSFSFANISLCLAKQATKLKYKQSKCLNNKHYNLSLMNTECINDTYNHYCKLFQFCKHYNSMYLVNSFQTHVSTISQENRISEKTKFILPSSPYKSHIETILCNHFSCNINFTFFQTFNIFQNSFFLIDEIIYYLEKRVPFFKIKNYILKKLAEQKSNRIKGIRVMCSGRVGGKSKKAQRSKIQNFKYGETSLHVFSSKIDFKSKNAFTSFGTLGIKVWVCYR